eukprot:TRINITY_DN73294_c0_g1_i2.p3 TRINITY_DN73294_c0_g1~~TRINITY_DN73294_c0_g1_i2.p3  ORF type:complete len:252 (+),score=-27.20 TRINITY_DN73294_c0_g1_i2:480-1235(+)
MSKSNHQLTEKKKYALNNPNPLKYPHIKLTHPINVGYTYQKSQHKPTQKLQNQHIYTYIYVCVYIDIYVYISSKILNIFALLKKAKTNTRAAKMVLCYQHIDRQLPYSYCKSTTITIKSNRRLKVPINLPLKHLNPTDDNTLYMYISQMAEIPKSKYIHIYIYNIYVLFCTYMYKGTTRINTIIRIYKYVQSNVNHTFTFQKPQQLLNNYHETTIVVFMRSTKSLTRIHNRPKLLEKRKKHYFYQHAQYVT